MINPNGSYCERVGEATSQWIAAVANFPDPNLTISYYAGEAQAQGRWWGLVFAPLINLMFWDKSHCLNAYKNRT